MNAEHTTAQPNGEGRYAFDRCNAYPLPDNRVLVRNPRSGRQAVLTPDVHAALSTCTTFQTLPEHARRLAASHPGLHGQEAAIERILDSARHEGLLISARIYCTTLGGAVQPQLENDRPVAAIITWERPDALARCLDSIAGNCDLANVQALYVVDDSRDETAQSRNRDTTEAFAERSATPVYYLGADEQRAYVDRLVARVPALEDAVRFLVDRDRWSGFWTSGLARTVALLVSAGRRLLVLDDDILAEVYEPLARDVAPGFGDSGREAAFFGNDDEWAGSRATTETDPFARHLRSLGARLPDALGALGAGELPESSFTGATVPYLEGLGDASRVLVTECGSLGDPGTARLDWITGLEGASRERLLASADTVNNALTRRNCWSGQSRPYFSSRANMSQLTGLDNRRLLPPYLPILRGEDKLFGDMTAFLHPGSVVLDDAWAIPHKPIPERAWTDEDRQLCTDSAFPKFAAGWVEAHAEAARPGDPVSRLRRLAQLYADLAERDHEQLRELHIDHVLKARAEDYRHLKAVQSETPDAPEAWQHFVQAGIERLNRELAVDPGTGPLKGHPQGLSDQALTDWWRTFWRDLSRALQAWPAIRQAAQRLNEGANRP